MEINETPTRKLAEGRDGTGVGTRQDWRHVVEGVQLNSGYSAAKEGQPLCAVLWADARDMELILQN